jgi:hypothetical protein
MQRTKHTVFTIAAMMLIAAAVPLFAAHTPNLQARQATVTQGTLLRVDLNAKLLSIQTTEGDHMVFRYSDDTTITGADHGAEGLAGMSGAHVRVRYTMHGAENVAYDIAVLPKT